MRDTRRDESCGPLRLRLPPHRSRQPHRFGRLSPLRDGRHLRNRLLVAGTHYLCRPAHRPWWRGLGDLADFPATERNASGHDDERSTCATNYAPGACRSRATCRRSNLPRLPRRPGSSPKSSRTGGSRSGSRTRPLTPDCPRNSPVSGGQTDERTSTQLDRVRRVGVGQVWETNGSHDDVVVRAFQVSDCVDDSVGTPTRNRRLPSRRAAIRSTPFSGRCSAASAPR